MIIAGEQKGAVLTLTVTFDDPQQVEVFHQCFMEMVNNYAEKSGGIIVGADGEPTDGDKGKHFVNWSELSNKMGNND